MNVLWEDITLFLSLSNINLSIQSEIHIGAKRALRHRKPKTVMYPQ